MATIENRLFAEFADALNAELAAVGASLRVDQVPPRSGVGITLIDGERNEIGWLPDHADAEIIAAIEPLLANS